MTLSYYYYYYYDYSLALLKHSSKDSHGCRIELLVAEVSTNHGRVESDRDCVRVGTGNGDLVQRPVDIISNNRYEPTN